MPGLTGRICGICPVSHLLASAKAGDAILAVQPPESAVQLRRLMNLAQIAQSHALSFFHLSAPDLLLGLDSPPEQRNLVGLLAKDAEFARAGIRLRKFGQDVIEALGGKKIHPAWAVAGGVRHGLEPEARRALSLALPEALDTALRGLERWHQVLPRLEAEREHFGKFAGLFLGLVDADGHWEHYDGRLALMDEHGQISELDPAEYDQWLDEAVEDWSYLKFPFYQCVLSCGHPSGR
jgi:NAD-reducing hydrogenase large subunit